MVQFEIKKIQLLPKTDDCMRAEVEVHTTNGDFFVRIKLPQLILAWWGVQEDNEKWGKLRELCPLVINHMFVHGNIEKGFTFTTSPGTYSTFEETKNTLSKGTPPVTAPLSEITEGGFEIIKKARIKMNNEIWTFHKNDSDTFPSIPHGHNYMTNEKLDPYNGNIYKDRKLTRRLNHKQLESIKRNLRASKIFCSYFQ